MSARSNNHSRGSKGDTCAWPRRASYSVADKPFLDIRPISSCCHSHLCGLSSSTGAQHTNGSNQDPRRRSAYLLLTGIYRMCSPRSSPRRPRMLTGLLATPDVSRYVQQRKEVASQDDQSSPRSLVPKSYQSPRSQLNHRYNFANNSAGPGTTAIADAAATAFVGAGRVSSQLGKTHYATDQLGQYQQRQPWEHQQQDNHHNHQGVPAPAPALSSFQSLASLPSCQFLQATEGLQPLVPPTPTNSTSSINNVSSRAASFNYSQTPRHSSVTSAASGSTLALPTVPVVAAAPALPAVPAARTLPSQSNELKVLLDRNAMTNKRIRDSRCFESNYKMSLHPYGRSGNSQGGQSEHHSHCIHISGHDVGDSQSHQQHQQHQQSCHHQYHQSSCHQPSHNYSSQHHSHQSSHRSPQQHSSFVSCFSSARSQSAPSRQGSEHGTSASTCGSVYPPYVHGAQTVNMPSDAILGQALEIARDSDDGPSDLHIHNILEAALYFIYQRVSKDPEMSLTPTQFSLWNYMQHRFRGGPEETLWRIVTVKYWSEHHE